MAKKHLAVFLGVWWKAEIVSDWIFSWSDLRKVGGQLGSSCACGKKWKEGELKKESNRSKEDQNLKIWNVLLIKWGLQCSVGKENKPVARAWFNPTKVGKAHWRRGSSHFGILGLPSGLAG